MEQLRFAPPAVAAPQVDVHTLPPGTEEATNRLLAAVTPSKPEPNKVTGKEEEGHEERVRATLSSHREEEDTEDNTGEQET